MNGRNDEGSPDFAPYFDERLYDAEKEKLPPYPFCRTPEKCAGKGSCPNDPCCAD